MPVSSVVAVTRYLRDTIAGRNSVFLFTVSFWWGKHGRSGHSISEAQRKYRKEQREQISPVTCP